MHRILALALALAPLAVSTVASAQRLPEFPRGQKLEVYKTVDLGRVLALKDQLHAFDMSISGNDDPQAAATTCGYVVNKFICKSQGSQANKDLAAACSGGGEFACTGAGENRTCACAFD